MRFPTAITVLATIAAAALVAGCSASRTQGTGGRVLVVATTTQVADFARVVGGDAVEVYEVVGPNIDPHDFEPAPADLDALHRAAVVVENGVGLEAWLADTLASAEPTGVVVDASQDVSIRSEGAAPDPHIWQDPRNAAVMATNIERGLAAADPARAAGYATRLAAYRVELTQLDTDIAAAISALPDRRLVTNHDAFRYFVDRYGLVYVGSIIPSFDSSAELSASQVADIVQAIRATGTKAVFSESSLPGRAAETIAREAGVTVVAGEDALYGDSLGPAGSAGDTYLKMMRHNAEVIVDALR